MLRLLHDDSYIEMNNLFVSRCIRSSELRNVHGKKVDAIQALRSGERGGPFRERGKAERMNLKQDYRHMNCRASIQVIMYCFGSDVSPWS